MLSSSPLGALVRARGIDLEALLEQMLERIDGWSPGCPSTSRDLPPPVSPPLRLPLSRRRTTGSPSSGRRSSRCPTIASRSSRDGHVERTGGRLPGAGACPRAAGRPRAGKSQHAAPGDRVGRLVAPATVERASRHVPLSNSRSRPDAGFFLALTTGDDDRPDGNLIAEDRPWRNSNLWSLGASGSRADGRGWPARPPSGQMRGPARPQRARSAASSATPST